VDDSGPNRKFLARLLANAGHAVEQTVDGQEALEMVTQSMTPDGERYDTILCDYEMPRMNGPEFAAAIRAIGSGKFMREQMRFAFCLDIASQYPRRLVCCLV